MLPQEGLLRGDERRQRFELEETHFVDFGTRPLRATMRAAPEPDLESLRACARSKLENLDELDDKT
jgi:hypothetical protein